MDMTTRDRAQAMVLGALVGDAASLGFHWLYDQERIRILAPDEPEFRTPSADDFADTRGYFAHAGKSAGEQSQYGEQTLVMLDVLGRNGGGYDKARYEAAFVAHFGYGGAYVGYIDRATRDTLDAVGQARRAATLAGQDDIDSRPFRGSDDTQLPALAKLPALIAAGCIKAGSKVTDTDRLAMQADVESAVRVTNDNDISVASGRFVAAMIGAAVSGKAPLAAIEIAQDQAASDTVIDGLIVEALTMLDTDNRDATAHFGLSCELTKAMPSLVHNLATSDSYVTGIRQNILAGGDSCGRAIVIGAMLGAVHGVGGARGIPTAWLERLSARTRVERLSDFQASDSVT